VFYLVYCVLNLLYCLYFLLVCSSFLAIRVCILAIHTLLSSLILNWTCIYLIHFYSMVLVHHYVFIYFWSFEILNCMVYLKIEFRSCARGLQWCGIFYNHWWTALKSPPYSHTILLSIRVSSMVLIVNGWYWRSCQCISLKCVPSNVSVILWEKQSSSFTCVYI